MPKAINKVNAKKFVQVSLPAAFAESLREQADSSDRSMAAQLEHWARIARAIETIAPAHTIASVKTAQQPNDVLRALAVFVMTPNVDALSNRLATSGVPSFGTDPDHPGHVLKHMPDGSVVTGKFDDEGTFHPDPLDIKSHRSNQDATDSVKSTPKLTRRVSDRKETRNRAKELTHA